MLEAHKLISARMTFVWYMSNILLRNALVPKSTYPITPSLPKLAQPIPCFTSKKRDYLSETKLARKLYHRSIHLSARRGEISPPSCQHDRNMHHALTSALDDRSCLHGLSVQEPHVVHSGRRGTEPVYWWVAIVCLTLHGISWSLKLMSMTSERYRLSSEREPHKVPRCPKPWERWGLAKDHTLFFTNKLDRVIAVSLAAVIFLYSGRKLASAYQWWFSYVTRH